MSDLGTCAMGLVLALYAFHAVMGYLPPPFDALFGEDDSE